MEKKSNTPSLPRFTAAMAREELAAFTGGTFATAGGGREAASDTTPPSAKAHPGR